MQAQGLPSAAFPGISTEKQLDSNASPIRGPCCKRKLCPLRPSSAHGAEGECSLGFAKEDLAEAEVTRWQLSYAGILVEHALRWLWAPGSQHLVLCAKHPPSATLREAQALSPA